VENLQSASDGMGRSLEVMEIPLPGPAFDPAGAPLGRSYTSFYCANGAVLVPQFGDPQDGAAVEILSRCFPSREILPVPAAEISAGGGSLQRLILPQPKA